MGRLMWFLVRMAFWLSIVVMVMPAGRSRQTGPAQQVGAGEAIAAVTAAISDMRQFCSRQPDTCAVAARAIVQFGGKVQMSANTFLAYLNERLANRPATASDDVEKPARAPSQNTLTHADLVAPWRGRQP
jgi:hypothetical protein